MLPDQCSRIGVAAFDVLGGERLCLCEEAVANDRDPRIATSAGLRPKEQRSFLGPGVSQIGFGGDGVVGWSAAVGPAGIGWLGQFDFGWGNIAPGGLVNEGTHIGECKEDDQSEDDQGDESCGEESGDRVEVVELRAFLRWCCH